MSDYISREAAKTRGKIAISVTEAAELLGLSRPTVYKLMRRNDFPVLRIGTRTLIHRAKLEELAAKETERTMLTGI